MVTGERKETNLRLLNSKYPKEFWKKLKLKKGGIDTKLKKNELFEYFSRLSSDENTKSDDSTFSSPAEHENKSSYDNTQN